MLRTFAATLVATGFAAAQTNFPPPPSPAGNQQTPQKELLGMALFFEEQMASNGQVACATCHDFRHGGADPRAQHARNFGRDQLRGTDDDIHGSPGVPMMVGTNPPTAIANEHFGLGPQVTPRRAPTVVNSGYHPSLGYDGRHASLEELVRTPLLNPIEMGHWGRTSADVVAKVTQAEPLRLATNVPPRLQTFIAGRTYPDLFALAFGTPAVTEQRISKAIAAYLRTLNSDQSRWDLHLAGLVTLTAQEQLGLQLFTTPANGATACNTCHGDFNTDVVTTGPIVGQMTMTTSGPYGAIFPTRLLFHNIGVRPPNEDPGRSDVTGAVADEGKFRTASLRNVELTAPYFHTGGAATLRDAIDFYDRGGNFHQNQAAMLTPRNYTPAEKDALVAILRTLTDPRLVAGTQPFDRPTLGAENGRLPQPFGTPSLTASGELRAAVPFAPLVGSSQFEMAVTGASVGTLTFLMWDTAIGRSQTTIPNLELGLTPAFAIYSGGPAQWSFMTPTQGSARLPVPIPQNPQLYGTVLFAQWAALEPARNAPISLSNAVRIELR